MVPTSLMAQVHRFMGIMENIDIPVKSGNCYWGNSVSGFSISSPQRGWQDGYQDGDESDNIEKPVAAMPSPVETTDFRLRL